MSSSGGTTFPAAPEPGPGRPWAIAFGPGETSAEARARLRAAVPPIAMQGSVVVLATCRRLELFGFGEPPGLDELAGASGVPEATVGRVYLGHAAIERVIRIAVGLESAIIGEDQVLRQIRSSLAPEGVSGRASSLDPRLRRLVETAIAAGRRARASRPRLERGFADRGIAWLEGRLGDLGARRIVVAGAGPIGEATAHGLARRGATVVVASRDEGRAVSLATTIGGVARTLESVLTELGSADGLVVALAGPWPGLADVPGGLPATVDLSAPTVVPREVAARLADAFADLDLLAGLSSAGAAEAAAAAAYREHAEAIVAEAVDDFEAWLLGRGSIEALRALRSRAEARRAERLEQLFRRLPGLGQHERALIEQLSQQLVATLLHEPSRQLSMDPDGSGSAAAWSLFDLGATR